MVDKVNGKINAIHDDSLELMEFKGCFSPFNLEELEIRVCRLTDQNRDKDNLPEPQQVPQIQDLDSNLGLLTIEDMTGMALTLIITVPYHLLEMQPHNNQGQHYQHLPLTCWRGQFQNIRPNS